MISLPLGYKVRKLRIFMDLVGKRNDFSLNCKTSQLYALQKIENGIYTYRYRNDYNDRARLKKLESFVQ
ncbi:hypothetical protein CW304_10385 [Bacillus sp. UFRGS-B20]|nr:hypothetical protein CW304_10385 [Bacillus sp. UFRGS-B20]